MTGCLPTDSGLVGLPLKCQLQSNMPAALMIYRNSSVCLSELSLWESDDSRAVLQPPKAAFFLWLSGSHHIEGSSYTSKGLCMRRTGNFNLFYWWVHRCVSVDFVPNSGYMWGDENCWCAFVLGLCALNSFGQFSVGWWKRWWCLDSKYCQGKLVQAKAESFNLWKGLLDKRGQTSVQHLPKRSWVEFPALLEHLLFLAIWSNSVAILLGWNREVCREPNPAYP